MAVFLYQIWVIEHDRNEKCTRKVHSGKLKKISVDILQSQRLAFVLRIPLGGSLLVFGASKLPDLAGFADTVVSYKVLPESLAIPFGYALPPVEVIVGSFLVLGLFQKFVAPIAVLIAASFIGGTAGTLYLFATKGP